MNWYLISAVYIKSSLDPDGHKHNQGLQPAGEVRELASIFFLASQSWQGVVIFKGVHVFIFLYPPCFSFDGMG